LLSVPRGTEMFQFPRFPLPVLCVQTGVTPHHGCRVSPFGYLRINAWSAAPRSFSQPPTSFIGVRRQGIHRWPFVAWKNKDARARYAVLKELRGRTKVPPGRRGRRRQPLGGLAGVASRVREFAPSKQKRGHCVSNRLGGREGKPTTDAVYLDQTERGSNWESFLLCAGTLTP
jgi:hypothetical protein